MSLRRLCRNKRGSFNGFSWDVAPRLLFVCKAVHQLTGDAAWGKRYRTALQEGPEQGGMTRLQACERGMLFERGFRHSWTGSCGAIALRALWEMESDEEVRAAFARGLTASARLAAEGVALCRQFKNDSQSQFEGDWRKMNALWREQKAEDEASALAREQLAWINQRSPRRREEMNFVREPLFAAWIVTLCPDRAFVAQHRAVVLEALAHYRYERLHYSQFFPAEAAWHRLPA